MVFVDDHPNRAHDYQTDSDDTDEERDDGEGVHDRREDLPSFQAAHHNMPDSASQSFPSRHFIEVMPVPEIDILKDASFQKSATVIPTLPALGLLEHLRRNSASTGLEGNAFAASTNLTRSSSPGGYPSSSDLTNRDPAFNRSICLLPLQDDEAMLLNYFMTDLCSWVGIEH